MKKFLIIFIIVILLILGFLNYLIGKPIQSAGFFEIKAGQSLKEIAENLETERILNSKYPFLVYVLIKGKADKLQPGFYAFAPEDSFITIAQKIIEGRKIRIKITFPEGNNLKEVQEKLVKAGILTPGELESLRVSDFKNGFSFLASVPQNQSLEGFLFPDTYYFEPKMTNYEVAGVFLKNFEEKLNSETREEIAAQEKTTFEIIIMASLIEKEVRNLKDKKMVAGILWKRLENGIPLQVDATITYLTGEKTTEVSLQETKIDSPYNTYKYLGLPSGPICNPGIDSIEAVVYPESSQNWYYLSTPEGKTIFNKTLEEHNIDKAYYLK